MGKTMKPATLKVVPSKKGTSVKPWTSPRSAKSKDNGSSKRYWVVKPQFGEAKWFGEELFANNYIESLKGNPYVMKSFIIFEHARKEVEDHNNRLSLDNSKFQRQLEKEAGTDDD